SDILDSRNALFFVALFNFVQNDRSCIATRTSGARSAYSSLERATLWFFHLFIGRGNNTSNIKQYHRNSVWESWWQHTAASRGLSSRSKSSNMFSFGGAL